MYIEASATVDTQSAGGPNGRKTIKLMRATAVEAAEFEQQKRQVRCILRLRPRAGQRSFEGDLRLISWIHTLVSAQ